MQRFSRLGCVRAVVVTLGKVVVRSSAEIRAGTKDAFLESEGLSCTSLDYKSRISRYWHSSSSRQETRRLKWGLWELNVKNAGQ